MGRDDEALNMVLAFIRDNPGVTPREIADALGMPLWDVRKIIYKLREEGYVVRSSKGYVARVAPPSTYGISLKGSEDSYSLIKDEVNQLRKELQDLKARVEKLEAQLRELFIGIQGKRRQAGHEKIVRGGDRLLSELKEIGVVPISRAKAIASFPVETYVARGDAVIIGQYVVDPGFLEAFKRKFPLPVTMARKLSSSEKMLLDELMREGRVYLYAGREYRLVE